MSTARVLIADDSLVIRAVVRSGLEEEGYDVVEAVDGLTALAQCRKDPPDVVLLDVEMPGLDGYEVLCELKADVELKDIPVVFLTSRAATTDIVTGLRGGAHDYLKKPFEPAELLARVGSAVHVKKLQDELQQRNAELDRLSRTDGLTGLHNRWHLERELSRLHNSSVRHHDPLSVLILDLDHFKQINDTHGHGAGDDVLRAFAGRMSRELRSGDLGGRWGGEEFLVVLPRTDLDGAFEIADRIRSAIAAEPVTVGDDDIVVTVSGGCALGPGPSAEALVHRADTALYEAKVDGRNRVAIATP